MAPNKVMVTPEKGEGRGWTVDQSSPTPPIGTFRTQREAIVRARQARTLGAKENRRSKG